MTPLRVIFLKIILCLLFQWGMQIFNLLTIMRDQCTWFTDDVNNIFTGYYRDNTTSHCFLLLGRINKEYFAADEMLNNSLQYGNVANMKNKSETRFQEILDKCTLQEAKINKSQYSGNILIKNGKRCGNWARSDVQAFSLLKVGLRQFCFFRQLDMRQHC